MTNLISIDELIATAQDLKISLGAGNAKVHLAYLTSIGLLPKTTKRKVNGEIIGCYPQSVIEKLQQINDLKKQGLSYSQMKLVISNPNQVSSFPLQYSSPHLTLSPVNFSGLAFLIVGLILGYLLAFQNFAKSGPSVPSFKSADISDLPGGNKIKLSTITNSSDNQPVYLIVLPKQNLDNLGKIDINSLNKN